MADNDRITVELDTNGMEKDLESAVAGISEVRMTLLRLHEMVVKGFTSIENSINTVETGVENAEQSLGTALGTLTSVISTSMCNIVQGVNNIFETLRELRNDQAVGNFGDSAFQAVDITFKAMELLQQYTNSGNGGSTGKNKGTLLLPAGASGDGGSSAIVSFGGNLGEMMTNPLAEEMVQGISNVISKLKESVAAWGAQTTAKLADAAADKSSTTTMLDCIKNLGTTLGQLASNTAAWIANAAAKAGSTAAEWAQIAATTTWTAICSAATAVTSAFGAAMSVLTSPITLVIAGVAALMAGFNATVQELRMLRQDVGNIRVGDEVIGRAAQRYTERRAVMQGTPW